MTVAFEKYLGGTNDSTKKQERFKDLISDIVFGVPSVTIARAHRGESPALDKRGTLSYECLSLSCPPPSIDRCGNCLC